jgi:hypothetical protein
MSKHLSTGAGAAYGQPFAFTTGVDDAPKAANGARPKGQKERKKAARKRRSERLKAAKQATAEAAAAEKKHHKHKHPSPFTAEELATMKQIGKTHTEARYSAFLLSTDITALNVALRAANAAALQSKIDILEQYNKSAEGVENGKMRRMRKDLAYFSSPSGKTDSRTFTTEQFSDFKKIYAGFYQDEINLMQNGHTGTGLRAYMKDFVDKKKQELADFYDKYPALRPISQRNAEQLKVIGG